ncbi:MAG: hypothetical protein AB8F78_05245 [Saprospiraceae bacterium]
MKRIVQLWIAAAVSIVVMWPLFLAQPKLAPVLKAPQTQLFSQGGDAWKNIYTVAYHTVHDEGLIETQAFNYPDGEHVAFADGQPLLTWGLKGLRVNKVETVYAVVQLLPFIGCILGAVLLTWLLLRLRMPLVYAILFGIGIALLSPQMTRATGHFGLSYVFALPTILHLLLNWAERRTWKEVGWLILGVVLLGQLHLYLLASGLLLSCTFMLSTQWMGWKGSGLRVFAQVAVLAIVSFVISKGIVDLTWMVDDRPAAPYGLKAFVSYWEDMIIDRDLPWWSWFSDNVSKIREPGGFEGKGYLGIVTAVFTVFLLIKFVLVRSISILFRGKGLNPALNKVASVESRKHLLSLSLVSLVSFVIASGVLLHIPGLELVLDQLGALRQFRSLGRFIWVLYYAVQLVSATVITAWCLTKFAEHKRLGSSAKAFVFRAIPIVFALLLIFEGNKALSSIDASVAPQRYDVANWAEALGNTDSYQAILPLPYFHVGSENYNSLARFGQIAPSTQLSLQTGLPNMGVMMSRQSGKLSRERLGLNMPWIDIPAVLLKLDPDKPIVIVGQRTTMRENEAAGSAHDYMPWFAEADTLYMDEEAVILSFLPSVSNLKKVQQNYCERLQASTTLAKELKGRLYINSLAERSYALNFEDAAVISTAGFQEVDRWPRYGTGDSIIQEDLKITWLTYIGEDGYAGNTYEVRLTDSSSGQISTIGTVRAISNARYYFRDWAQLEVIVPSNVNGNELSLWGKMVRHPNVDRLITRNLLSVPADSSVLWSRDFGLMKDGLLLRACH